MTIIINQMLHSGIFPGTLKVIPLYKKDDKQLFSNYRPISLLPSISKIFEKVILLQLTEYLDKNNILHQNQYGFRKNHSTELASLHLVDYIYFHMLLVYKAFTNGSPTYLADMMTSCNPVRSTRSSHKVNLLVVPHQKSNKYSEKAFAVVGPRLWNDLLTDELRGCNSVDTFKKKLKTMLFKKHY